MQNPRPREISRAEGGVFSDTSLLSSVYVHSLILDREGLDLTLSGCDKGFEFEKVKKRTFLSTFLRTFFFEYFFEYFFSTFLSKFYSKKHLKPKSHLRTFKFEQFFEDFFEYFFEYFFP